MQVTIESLRQAAKDADLTPRIAYQLRDFFLELRRETSFKELDDWVHAGAANDQLFELLAESRLDGRLVPNLNLVIKLAKRSVNPFYRYREALKIALMALLVILLLDYFIPSHPLSRLVFGEGTTGLALGQTTVHTNSEARTIWLADSTRIELQPNSTAHYPNELSWSNRSLKINGAATITARGSLQNPLQLEAGKYIVQVSDDAVVHYDQEQLTMEEVK